MARGATIVVSGTRRRQKHSPYIAAAEKNDTTRQTLWACRVAKRNMGPINTEARVPAFLDGIMPKTGDGLLFDEGVVNANLPAWTERFNREIAK